MAALWIMIMAPTLTETESTAMATMDAAEAARPSR